MATDNRFIAITLCDKPCEGETFNAEGFPEKCKDARVFELSHSNGHKIHLCEYHIQCSWSFWPTFRDAVRDIWPVRQRHRS
jgi:hypothetical protein